MTIAEIRQIEESREGTMNVVHLIKEGAFYHANDWSAWLMTKFPVGEAARKPMTVTASKMNDGYIQAFVGFPATSMEKYIPNDGTVEFNPVSDIQIDMVVNADFGEATVGGIRQIVDEWKETLPLRQTKKQNRENRGVSKEAPRIVRITDVISRIVSIPMEDISPKQAYDLLRELRREITDLF